MSIRLRWEIWKLRRRRTKLTEEGSRVAKKAKKQKDECIFEEWDANHRWELDVIDAEMKQSISRDVMQQAEGLYLPTPSYNDKAKWVSRDQLGINSAQRMWILTPEAMSELNRVIRQERVARLGVWESWAKIVGTAVASLTGIIGAIIGLVAILKK